MQVSFHLTPRKLTGFNIMNTTTLFNNKKQDIWGRRSCKENNSIELSCPQSFEDSPEIDCLNAKAFDMTVTINHGSN